MTAQYSFAAELWRWDAKQSATWVFVSLPDEHADDIDERFGQRSVGFGSIRVEVTIGASTWRTSLFPSTSEKTYVLPIKKAVRAAEGVAEGDTVQVGLRVLVDGT